MAVRVVVTRPANVMHITAEDVPRFKLDECSQGDDGGDLFCKDSVTHMHPDADGAMPLCTKHVGACHECFTFEEIVEQKRCLYCWYTNGTHSAQCRGAWGGGPRPAIECRNCEKLILENERLTMLVDELRTGNSTGKSKGEGEHG